MTNALPRRTLSWCSHKSGTQWFPAARKASRARDSTTSGMPSTSYRSFQTTGYPNSLACDGRTGTDMPLTLNRDLLTWVVMGEEGMGVFPLPARCLLVVPRPGRFAEDSGLPADLVRLMLALAR